MRLPRRVHRRAIAALPDVRLSVGIEHIDAIIADIERGLTASSIALAA